MGQTSQLLGAIFLLLLTIYLFKTLTTHLKRRSQKKIHHCSPPPKYPHKDPILGLDLYLSNTANLKSHTFLRGLIARWQEHSHTFSGLMLGSPTVWTVDPKNLQAVHGTNASHFGVEPMRLAGTLQFLGRGIFNSDGVFWEHSRALIRPTFTRSNVANLPAFEAHFRKFLKLLPRNGETIDLEPFLNRLFLDTSTEFLFGESMRTLDSSAPHEAREFLDCFHYAMAGTNKKMMLRKLRFLHRDRKWTECVKIVHTFIDGYVDKAFSYPNSVDEKELIEKEGDEASGQRYILLHEMAKETTNRVELRHQILHVFLAGHDAAGITVAHALFHLCRNPPMFQRLRKEVLAASHEPLTFEQLKHVQFLQWVIKETLRINPVVATDTRIAIRDTVLPTGGGANGTSPVFITKGSGVATAWHAVHHLAPCFQPDPEVFRPERWETLKPGWSYLPFGGGPRACPGQNLALTEVAYVLSRLAQEFKDIECRDDVVEWVEKLQMTATSRNGIKVALNPA